MTTNRILYRTYQFWRALGGTLTSEDIELVRKVLTPAQLKLYERLQLSEKVHSLRVLRVLLAQGEKHPDLFVAALLHDVGKSRFPLNLWQRVLIVLVQAIFPHWAKRLGSEPNWSNSNHPDSLAEAISRGWRKPFIVAENHPEWGAEMLAATGASSLAITLVKRHQDHLVTQTNRDLSLEERLLRKLQSVDDNN